MNGRSFSVRFNESFLQNSKHLLTEGDLKQLSCILCDDPFGNQPHPSIGSLYCLEWMVEEEGLNEATDFLIWYVADESVAHIEVVSITTKEDDGEPDSDHKAVGFVRWLIRLVNAAKRLYEQWSDDQTDGPDFIDFGL